MTGYAPNISGRIGYMFPETEMPGAGMRLSLIYYDGQSTINNFNLHSGALYGNRIHYRRVATGFIPAQACHT